MNKYLLDSLYNQKSICEALLKGGYHQAASLFHSRAASLHDQPKEELPILRCIFLNSLNKSLYNYILYAWDISLAQCCYENMKYSHHYESEVHFLEAGELILRSYARQMCASCPQAGHMEKACCYIKNHLDQELTLDIVAQNIYVSKSHLAQNFKTFVGQSFSEYVSNQRIIQARNLLLTTELKVDEIAQRCGFLSSTYFSTVFKKSTGYTPRTFRRQFGGASKYHAAV